MTQTFYQEQGYYLARGLFSPAQMDALEEDFDRIVDKILSGGGETANARWSGPEMERLQAQATTVVHTHNVQQYSARWHEALLDPGFLAATRQLLGPDVVLHHTKLFMKPPEKGAPFPMHQDWPYFPTVRDTMLAAVIHVSDATDEMGCFRVFPSSHKLGRITGASGMEKSELLEKYPLEEAEVIEAKRGDVLFFHYFLLHGSRGNTSSRPRKTVLVQMHAGDDAVEEGCAHPDEHVVLAGFNHGMTRTKAGARKT